MLLFASAATLPFVAANAQVAPAPSSALASDVSAAVRNPAAPSPHPARHSAWSGRPASPTLRRVAVANRAATKEPESSGFLNAIQVYAFADGSLYRLYTSPERVTDIALQPGETLISVAAGDTARWVIGDTSSGRGDTKRTHILVKPFSAGLATNLVITTDRRSYHLDLTSTSGPAMAALSWTYPQDGMIAIRHAAEHEQAVAPIASGLAVEQFHFNYEISGDEPDWRPLRAFDDGRQTFIQFPASIAVGEAPPLFIVDQKGGASLVNYRMQGRFYVVDRIFDAAELRLGTKKQTIVRITRVSENSRGRRGS
jgi:type IV secretion system protein VirB9